MRLKTLKKKIRKLEARLQEGPAKLAKLKQKLEAMTKAKAMKARRKAAVRASKAREMAESLTPIQKKKDGLTQPPVKLAGATRRTGKKVKRKLNLSPERRAQLAAAMKARWAAKRAAAEANSQNVLEGPSPTGLDELRLPPLVSG
jgi:predicted  nucleic acid-binding Zn-ribbon protein